MFTPVIARSWRGASALKNLVIFGDSYSAVGYNPTYPHPTRESPLGIKFPGLTYNEADEPNWVGHFVTNYSPNPDLLVYDYAVGGATAQGVKGQCHSFLNHVGKKPEWAPWTSEDTLFVTWVGINDCAFTKDYARNMQILLATQEALYQNGARNFLFMNVPPINRSPATLNLQTDISYTYLNWNKSLSEMISEFTATHSDATALLFSTWETFTRILDDPVAHGFPKGDARRWGGSVWVDHLHPSSKVHDFIAKDVAIFLNKWPAFVET